MKAMKMNHVTAFLSAALVLLAVACVKDEPSLEIGSDDVPVAAAGGTFTVSYELVGTDAPVQAVCGSDWVGGFDVSVPGRITFEVSANTSAEPRQALVSVECQSCSGSFTVSQEGAAVPGFTVSVDAVTERTASFTVTPYDYAGEYVIAIVGEDYIEEGDDDDDVIRNILDTYEMQAYLFEGMSIEEYLREYELRSGVHKGFHDISSPDSEYLILVFGCTEDEQVTTGLFRASYRTKAPEKKDVSFGLDCAVSGYEADITITPSDNTVRYIVGVQSDLIYDSDEEYLADVEEGYEESFAYLMLSESLTIDDFLARLSIGPSVFSTGEMMPSGYYVHVAAVSDEACICSDIALAKFVIEEP